MNSPVSANPSLPRTAISETEYASVRDFLFDEAALLDARRYLDWFGTLTPDLSYQISARVTRAAEAEPQEFPILSDTAEDVETRVKQLSNPRLTFADNPPPFMRRFVGNIRVRRGTAASELSVDSNLLMCRSGGGTNESHTFAVERRDTLRWVDGALRLACRRAYLDQSVISSPNFPTFV